MSLSRFQESGESHSNVSGRAVQRAVVGAVVVADGGLRVAREVGELQRESLSTEAEVECHLASIEARYILQSGSGSRRNGSSGDRRSRRARATRRVVEGNGRHPDSA